MVPITRRKPAVSCVLLTDRLTAESARWFSDVKALTDELVIFVDINRADQETRGWAAGLATRLYEVPGKGYVEVHLREMFEACRCDWILRLDSDEQLSINGPESAWSDFLASAEYNHYQLPRRWLHPAGGFIDGEPWWPDPQFRLFRNELKEIIFPELIHEPMHRREEAGAVAHLAIHHHVLRLTRRAEREEKVRHYTRLRPDKPLGEYYLFEDAAVTIAPLPSHAGAAEPVEAF